MREVLLTFLVLSYSKSWKKNHRYAFELCAAISNDFENGNFQIQKANFIIELCSALTWDGVYCIHNKVKYLELLSFWHSSSQENCTDWKNQNFTTTAAQSAHMSSRKTVLWNARVGRISNYGDSGPQWYDLWCCGCLWSGILTFV